MIGINSADEFFKLQKNIDRIPFTQSLGWHDYQSDRNKQFRYFVDNKESVNIALWGKEQKIPLSSKKILIINGESLSNSVDEKIINTFYSALYNLNYFGIEINSNNIYNIDYEIGIRRAGFVRPVGVFSCPLTIALDLSNIFNFNRNWNRNFLKAKKEKLIFKEIESYSGEVVNQIIAMFNEMAKFKGLKYMLDKKNISKLIRSSDIRTFFVYDEMANPISSRIIHVNKPYSSDVYAANSLQARKCGATYFMMQNIFEILKNENYSSFDFGRIPPSNHSTDSVYVFKSASRGKKIQYNGEWVFYKNKGIELLMFIYKLLKLKKQRY